MICPHCGKPTEAKGVYVDRENGYLNVDDKAIPLSRDFAAFVEVLVNRMGRHISHQSFMTLLYSDRIDGGPQDKVVDVYIHRLRGIIRSHDLPLEVTTRWGYGHALRRK